MSGIKDAETVHLVARKEEEKKPGQLPQPTLNIHDLRTLPMVQSRVVALLVARRRLRRRLRTILHILTLTLTVIPTPTATHTALGECVRAVCDGNATLERAGW